MKKIEFIERYGKEAYETYKENEKNRQRTYCEREGFLQRKKEKMRYTKQMFAYCIPEEITSIENYELAKKENFDGWCIHHKMELVSTGAVVDSSKQELIDWEIYYNRPASELMFMRIAEHTRLHHKKGDR